MEVATRYGVVGLVAIGVMCETEFEGLLKLVLFVIHFTGTFKSLIVCGICLTSSNLVVEG